LAAPPPASFPELAGRAGNPASLAAALRSLDLGALRLAELLAVVGLPTTVAALAEAAGPGLDPGRLRAGLDTLAELGIALPGPDGSISGPPGLAAPFGRPGGLGPPVAELAKVGVSSERLDRILANLGLPSAAGASKAALVRSVSGALADPEVVARVLAGADPDVRRLLDQALVAPGPIAVMGVGYGRFAGYPDAEPASWLLERGLLLPVTYSQLVVPREAALGLRGGLVFPAWPQPPAADPLDRLPEGPAVAVAAAIRAVVAAEGVCTRLDREPLKLVRAGTVAVRDLRRLARDLDLADDELALLVDLLAETGVLTVGGPFGQRSLGLRPEADPWLAGSRARRWADLAAAWRAADLAVEDHLVARHSSAPAQSSPDRARPLAGRRLAAAAARRRGLLETLTTAPLPKAAIPGSSAAPGQAAAIRPPAAALAAADLAALLAWRQPMVWPAPPRRVPSRSPAAPHGAPRAAAAGAGTNLEEPEATVRAVLDAAAFLGLAVVAAGRAQGGLAAKEWVAGAGAGELAEVAAAALPAGSDRFLVAGDLTVVAPGGLAPGVETGLAALADREPSGSGTWRIHEASLRRAFDEGRSAGELLDFLRRHSSTRLPQALEYLIADAARRHGRLRVGAAATYLRGDPALVAGAVRSAAGRRLGLRELAPGVAVTTRGQGELLAALRKAGEAPLAEEPDGSPRPEAPRPVRHAQRAAPDRLGGSAPLPNGHAGRPAEADPAAVVARLRGRRPVEAPAPTGTDSRVGRG
jgi:XPB/Ssl2-like helicase family protein